MRVGAGEGGAPKRGEYMGGGRWPAPVEGEPGLGLELDRSAPRCFGGPVVRGAVTGRKTALGLTGGLTVLTLRR